MLPMKLCIGSKQRSQGNIKQLTIRQYEYVSHTHRHQKKITEIKIVKIVKITEVKIVKITEVKIPMQ